MNKRGQGIQFNWIFVIIAGALFLSFFIYFAIQYVELEQNKEDAKIARAIDSAVFSSKGLSQYKEFRENFPDFEVMYNGESLFVNGNINVGVELNDIVFMENEISKPLSLWSKEYERPYLIDTLVFLWESDLKFYFDGVSESFLDKLPNELKITDYNNADVLVYFGNANSNSNKKVIGFNGNVISFVNEGKTFNYNGDDIFVYGAMFSSSDIFEKSKLKLEQKELSLREIYIKKAQYFGSRCSEYSQIINSIDNAELVDSLNVNLDNHNCEVIF